MINKVLLKEAIKERGISITFLAKKIGISREGFYKKMNGTTEYKVSEVSKIKKILNLTDKDIDEIFFDKNSELNSRISKTKTLDYLFATDDSGSEEGRE